MKRKLDTNNKYSIVESNEQLLKGYIAMCGRITPKLKRSRSAKAVLVDSREAGYMLSEMISRGFTANNIEWLFPGIEVYYDPHGNFDTRDKWRIISRNISQGWVIIKQEDTLPIKVDDLTRISIATV